MDQILTLVRDYGVLIYLLLFAYCALKSGALPLFAGFAAQNGALDIWIVATAVLAGGYLGDEARFMVARRWGPALLARWPRLGPWVARGVSLLQRHGPAYIFLYRYPKGLRTVGAFPVGLTNLSWRRFTLLNFASALLWTVALVFGGYWLGAVLSGWIGQNWGWASTVLLLLFGAVSFAAWRKVSSQVREPSI